MSSDHSSGAAATPPTPRRRDVLDWLLGTWGAGVVGAVFYPILRFLAPPEIPESPTLTVSAGKASALLPNSGRLVPFGAEPAIVVRLAGGELRAFTGGVHPPVVHGPVPRRIFNTSGARATTATMT